MSGDAYRKLYGLRGNPFDHDGAYPLGHPEEMQIALAFGGRENAKEIISEILRKLSEGTSTSVLVIHGPYGYGKTHALRYTFYKAKQEFDNILPVYIKGLESPSGLELYRKVVTEIFMHYQPEFLINVFKNAYRKISERPSLAEAIKTTFSPLMRALPELASGNYKLLLWLRGDNDRVDMDELMKLGVLTLIEEENAANALSALAYVIYLGIGKKLLILVDELDEIIAKSDKKELTRFYAFLRDVIDLGSQYYSLVLALPPIALSGDRSIGTLYPALWSRIKSGGSIISLRKFEPEEAVKVVTAYLSRFRTPESKPLLEPIYPFSESAIREAVRLVQGVPRDFISLLHKALSDGVAKEIGEIGPEVIREAYEEWKRTISQAKGGEERREPEHPPFIPREDYTEIRKRELKEKYGEKLITLLTHNDGKLAWSAARDKLKISDEDLQLLVDAMQDRVGVLRFGKGKRKRIYLKR